MLKNRLRRTACALALWLLATASGFAQDNQPRPLAKLPSPAGDLSKAQVTLGHKLFFDKRLSGDATLSCATCHDPKNGWADGLPLSKGYPGTLYFRNTPTVVNAVHGKYLFWDGRLPASDLPTVVRDHIAEAHFLQADGRLVIERLRQVPEYEAEFKSTFGGEPTYGRILNATAAFVKSLQSQDVPFDKFLGGDDAAIGDSAKSGLALFKGKAGCIRCHDGAMLTDAKFHSLGLTSNPDIFRTPLRHITFRRFFRTLGVPNYRALRQDVGCYCVSKDEKQREQFRTPTLREVSRTAPYMHDGQLATLEDVVEFYNSGGGPRATKDPLLKPLGLTDQEKADLVEFLEALSGKPIELPEIKLPAYQLRKLGDN
jgi:cytochrome c peroxidase